MSGLPLLLSVPHAGLEVPEIAREYCILTPEEIAADGDVGAREIYALGDEVARFHTTEVARAIVDLNREPDDRSKDGVVKTHTCWGAPVYDPFPPEEIIAQLLRKRHAPYHEALSKEAEDANRYVLAIDCHTMAAEGPPVGPDEGKARPYVCLSNREGKTCPMAWLEGLGKCFADRLGEDQVALNDPFKGGYITRRHGQEMPWVQLELSRAPFMSDGEKRALVLECLGEWCASPLAGKRPG